MNIHMQVCVDMFLFLLGIYQGVEQLDHMVIIPSFFVYTSVLGLSTLITSAHRCLPYHTASFPVADPVEPSTYKALSTWELLHWAKCCLQTWRDEAGELPTRSHSWGRGSLVTLTSLTEVGSRKEERSQKKEITDHFFWETFPLKVVEKLDKS